MNDKATLLAEISSLVETNTNSDTLDLNIMEYMSFEELVSVRDNLKKRKDNRKEEQKEWYDEWIKKCGI
ncbi:MAG: hypothetical protein LBH45_02570 [Campylobacteraceae bacterium]|nr:hypothetical protein [Campylobacteraceae bacterium]